MAAYNSTTQYTRRLDDFRGVDLTSAQVQVSPKRFAYAQNMWRDYSAELGGAIETVPGFRALSTFSGTVHGIWSFRPFEDELYVLVHSGTSLYQFKHADRDLIAEDPAIVTEYTGLADLKSTAFVFNGRFYILDGESFRVLKKTAEGFELVAVQDTAYLPVTFINGEMYEQRNMLVDRTINRETQAPEYDASLLFEFDLMSSQGSLTYGSIVGFRSKNKADSIIILKRLRGVTSVHERPIDYIIGIGAEAFAGTGDIARVMVFNERDSTTQRFDIGTRAFYSATALRTVELCDVSVSTEAFASCSELRSVYSNACSLSARAFADCASLEEIRLVGDKALADLVFEGCSPVEVWLDKCAGFVASGNALNSGGSLGNTDRLERVHTAYSASQLGDEDLADLRAALDELYAMGVDIVYESPTPVKLDRVAGDSGGVYISNTLAREVVVYDPADGVESIKIGDEVIDVYGVSYALIDDEWHVEKVMITEPSKSDKPLTEREIDVVLNCKPGKFTTAKGYLDFASGNTDYEGTSRDAIVKCRISATFDGRLFLTGNAALPNTVFYCQRDNTGHPNPAYWGVLNYINDGVGQSANVAMLATANTLMVLKGNDPHDATIYYHAGVDSGNDVVPRIYPSERGLSGAGCAGVAVNFRDDAVFVSSTGLEAVGKQQVNLERTLMHRSSFVDGMLTRERLSDAVAVEWGGYLMIFTPSGNVYMADSRQMHQNGENIEYEWYLLSDIGVYEGQTEDFEQVTGDVDLYDEQTGLRWLSEEHTEAYAVIGDKRYAIELPPDEPQYVESAAVWNSHVYKAATGSDVWLDEVGDELHADVALFDGKAYFVQPSGRYSGGEFRCVTAAFDIDGVLYFGAQNGTVCCFNTDKRDVPYGDESPTSGAIHRHWYTFNGRQIDSFLTTVYDHAGYPDLAKKTVKKSLIIHAKTFPGSRAEVKVRTNLKNEWRHIGVISVATYDFYSLDYASAPLQSTEEALITIREKEKKWALKQLHFGSVGFMSPWGIYSVGYRFNITGRIKT